MNKHIKLLFAAALMLGVGAAHAASSCDPCEDVCKSSPTNKTHLTPRSHGVNIALEKTAGWPCLVHCRNQDDAIGGSVQAAFFVMGSTDEKKMAQYFLCQCPCPETVATSCPTDCAPKCGSDCASMDMPRQNTAEPVIVTSDAPAPRLEDGTGNIFSATARGAGSTQCRDLGFFVHDWNRGATGVVSTAPAPDPNPLPADNTAPGNGTGDARGNGVFASASDLPQNTTAASSDVKLTLCPKHEAIGVQFWYNQDLKCLVDGLYLQLHVPIVHVENELGMSVAGSLAADKDNLRKYLQGEYEVAQGEANAQKKLSCAKMAACGCERSETGVADIDFILGYKFLDKRDYRVALNLGLTIPTGNTPDGKYLFDAIVGNGGHVGFGFGVDAHALLWESKDRDTSLGLNFAFNYRYLFKDDECRTLGICGECFGQYALLIDRTVAPTNQQLTPAANVTTLRVDVTPGSQFDGMLSLNFNWGNMVFDLGYNLFLRSGEKVCLKGNKCATSCEPVVCDTSCGTKCSKTFPDGKWAIATRNADMSDAPDIGTISATNPMTLTNAQDWVYKTVDSRDLAPKSAETKSMDSHKLFGGVSYITKDWSMPVLVGVGAHYEWADCDLVSNWGFNARLGVGF